ncbi:Ser/Thr protein phosphatase [Tritrichomonas foetus]|uniref:Serine/threonine-protein phosphatase n=1 Tax=Tritrichomonas foetus TaxID=1144522 RepID=A0A1J4JDZ3_9EUKA|nr:Ser/Thr protein phosphatase [Tritrichomonas foetus]|eukprot:OHS95476.1 Ser/Thr protein phosphatase [Tritrichomonas foetus]
MNSVDYILRLYQPFIEKSPKDPDSNHEELTIFPRVDSKILLDVCSQAITYLEPCGSLINVSPPVVYAGDIHGNLTDLLQIFHIFGMPPETKYMFLGDYVDRGAHSIEVIAILFALICKYPDSIFLLRGNHEFSKCNRSYGFYDDILNSYGSSDAWAACNEAFSYMPLAAVVGGQVFCVHGGLSPMLTSLRSIIEIDMPIREYETDPLIADLVWSDPDNTIRTYEENSRGTGVLYGTEAIAAFLKANKLKVIIRGHQCVPTGYSLDCSNTCITLFSSSNYCRMLQNKAAVIHHQENREMQFYSLLEDSDVGVKPKCTMILPPAQQIGLKLVPKVQQTRKNRNGISSSASKGGRVSLSSSRCKSSCSFGAIPRFSPSGNSNCSSGSSSNSCSRNSSKSGTSRKSPFSTNTPPPSYLVPSVARAGGISTSGSNGSMSCAAQTKTSSSAAKNSPLAPSRTIRTSRSTQRFK